MSKDIRSFFKLISTKKCDEDIVPTNTKNDSPKKVNKKRFRDSDDEAEVPIKAQHKKPSKHAKRKGIIADSDSDEEIVSKVPKKADTPLKPVNISEIFGGHKIQQSEVAITSANDNVNPKRNTKGKSKKKNIPELKVHENDPDFQQTLIELEDDIFEENLETLDRTIETAKNSSKNEKKRKVEKVSDNKSNNGDREAKREPKKSPENKLTPRHIMKVISDEDFESNADASNRNDASQLSISNDVNMGENSCETTPKKGNKRPRTDNSVSKKQKLEHVDSGIDPDQERHEKRRYSAILYQKYLNRGTPKNQGNKDYPTGTPDCLMNLCFLKTGVLDSLVSEEFQDLVTKHGGRVVHSISKKVNYVVAGVEPGPSKLEKAQSLNIPIIDEDEFLDLILTNSKLPPKYSKSKEKTPSLSATSHSEDYGIVADIKQKNKSPKKVASDTVPSSKYLPMEVDDTFAGSKSRTLKVQPANADVKVQPDTGKRDTSLDSQWKSLSEKYRPQQLNQVIGQQEDSSCLNKLLKWLKNWHRSQQSDIRKKLIRPSPWAKNDDGAYFKCALLSGPPGIGKTTTANLVASSLGFDIVEFNASDTRNKRLLHEEVGQLLSTQSIADFAAGKSNVSAKRVLLMDEVDGMSGNEDRGGIQELIALIKSSKVPVICMCNDSQHPKIRTLANYCFDLRFIKPKMEQIRGAMLSICFKENIKVAPSLLGDIILSTGCDVRQTLNQLSMWKVDEKPVTTEQGQRDARLAKKDVVMSTWEASRRIFSETDNRDIPLLERNRLFFYDYSLIPLFVQENYLNVLPKGCDSKATLWRVAMTADSLSISDIVESRIRRSNNWALLDVQAFYSSVQPSHYMTGTVTRINFPSWLGKNSKRIKFRRIQTEIYSHARKSISGGQLAITQDYIIPLRDSILAPLSQQGLNGVDEAIKFMQNYSLLREDLDSLMELGLTAYRKLPNIESKVKAAFTRTYNKQLALVAHSRSKKKEPVETEVDENLDQWDNEDGADAADDIDDDDISSDAMVKMKVAKTSTSSGSKATTSKKAAPKKASAPKEKSKK